MSAGECRSCGDLLGHNPSCPTYGRVLLDVEQLVGTVTAAPFPAVATAVPFPMITLPDGPGAELDVASMLDALAPDERHPTRPDTKRPLMPQPTRPSKLAEQLAGPDPSPDPSAAAVDRLFGPSFVDPGPDPDRTGPVPMIGLDDVADLADPLARWAEAVSPIVGAQIEAVVEPDRIAGATNYRLRATIETNRVLISDTVLQQAYNPGDILDQTYADLVDVLTHRLHLATLRLAAAGAIEPTSLPLTTRELATTSPAVATARAYNEAVARRPAGFGDDGPALIRRLDPGAGDALRARAERQLADEAEERYLLGEGWLLFIAVVGIVLGIIAGAAIAGRAPSWAVSIPGSLLFAAFAGYFRDRR